MFILLIVLYLFLFLFLLNVYVYNILIALFTCNNLSGSITNFCPLDVRCAISVNVNKVTLKIRI